MNSKVSLFNWNYFKENMKKSRGVILLFALIIPIFTYLFMLLQNSNVQADMKLFPSLADLSFPVIFGMYVVPFVLSAVLFSFVFKKDSVDFINALPLKRETIYLTNIIGGIGIIFVIFLSTSILMYLLSFFFTSLVIPTSMYFHYFISFFISYSFVFVASSLALSLTGSRIVHVALTLIILFIPGFVSDFYNSRIYDNDMTAVDVTCSKYDTNCDVYQVVNNFKIEKSYKLENGQTLPYKYISFVPRALFGMNNNEMTFQSEIANVYNISSLLRMFILSIIYFAIGLYAFINRRMEIAETTFKSETEHQIVKCLTLFPLCLGAISIFNESKELVALWIMLAVTITIYVVYDLITRRNSGNFIKSLIYFLGLVLATILIYMTLTFMGSFEARKSINREDVASIGVLPNTSLTNGSSGDYNFEVLNYKIKDTKTIDYIFNRVDKTMSIQNGHNFAIRLNLKDGASYNFNMTLSDEDFNYMLKLLDSDNSYGNVLRDIDYDQVYGVKLGDNFLDSEKSDKIVSLIKEGFASKSVSDIVNATYLNYSDGSALRYNTMCTLYVYDGGIKTYSVSTLINAKLKNYVMQTYNDRYINDIKNKDVNVNQLSISFNSSGDEAQQTKYYQLQDSNVEDLYRYINQYVRNDTDFSKYSDEDILNFSIYFRFGNYRSYQVFIPRNDAFNQLLDKVKVIDTTPSIKDKQ